MSEAPHRACSVNVQAHTAPQASLSVRTFVHGKDELAWALANTDGFVVEGNDELRAYAERLLESPKAEVIHDRTPSADEIEAARYAPQRPEARSKLRWWAVAGAALGGILI